MENKKFNNTSILIRNVLVVGVLLSIVINFSVVFAYNNISNSDVCSGVFSDPELTDSPSYKNEDYFISISNLEKRVINLEAQVGTYSSLIDTQNNVFMATTARSESNINLLLGLMAFSSLVFGLIGLGFIKIWVEKSVEKYINSISENKLSELMEKEQFRIRNQWDPKFAKIYNEYLGIKPRDTDA